MARHTSPCFQECRLANTRVACAWCARITAQMPAAAQTYMLRTRQAHRPAFTVLLGHRRTVAFPEQAEPHDAHKAVLAPLPPQRSPRTYTHGARPHWKLCSRKLLHPSAVDKE